MILALRKATEQVDPVLLSVMKKRAQWHVTFFHCQDIDESWYELLRQLFSTQWILFNLQRFISVTTHSEQLRKIGLEREQNKHFSGLLRTAWECAGSENQYWIER